jgi:hypothetical protein
MDLSSNRLSGSLPSELGLLSQLIDLSLSSNFMSGQLPSELGLLTQLSHFSLFGNHFLD